jgi:hypothetical protein
MLMETREKVKGHVQKDKFDWWDCGHCGKQHKGFPYRCPEKPRFKEGENVCHGFGQE